MIRSIFLLALLGISAMSFAAEPLGSIKEVPIDLDLGTKRANWTTARWKVIPLPQPADWRNDRGLKLAIRTDRPRADAGVYVAVREADGSWYYHAWASDLTEARNEGIALFEDFSPPEHMSPPEGGYFDENGRLDLDQITHVAFGCVNPFGIGKVSYVVEGITVLSAGKTERAEVAVRIPGHRLDINGTSTIPAGLFGAFNLQDITTPTGKVSRASHYRLAQDRRINHDGYQAAPIHGNAITHMMINTVGDRVNASKRLTDANWKQRYEQSGQSFGAAAKQAGKLTYVEFWNEPYLNWANNNRRNFDPAFYDLSQAKEGGPVTLKLDGSPMPHLRWTRDFSAPPWNWAENLVQWRRGRDEKGNVKMPFAMPYHKWSPPKWRTESVKWNPPDTVKDGDTYTVDGTTYTAFTPWHVYDETQFTYWSGKGMLKPYVEPMIAYGRAMKQAGGDNIFFIAGWGNRPSEDHWAGFHQLYKDTIDAAPDLVDGICDHDYGGSPTKMPASYEVITAYGMTAHNKWLYSFNTETAMGSDPQAYPGAAEQKGPQADSAKARWTAIKLMHALVTSPDKARSFSWFGMGGGWFSDAGEGVTLNLLKNLRGMRLHVDHADPDLYVVAAIDGADPLNPRPADMPPGKELVIALLNDSLDRKTVNLSRQLPPGLKPRGNLLVQTIVDTAQGPSIETLDAAIVDQPFDIASRQIITITIPVEGDLPADAQTIRQSQFFADAILKEVKGDAPLNTTIAIQADRLPPAASAPRRAWIKIVTERLAEGEGIVVLNGREYPLPRAATPDNTPRVLSLPIRPEDLKPQNTLQFKTTRPTQAGYLIGMASLVLETEQ